MTLDWQLGKQVHYRTERALLCLGPGFLSVRVSHVSVDFGGESGEQTQNRAPWS